LQVGQVVGATPTYRDSVVKVKCYPLDLTPATQPTTKAISLHHLKPGLFGNRLPLGLAGVIGTPTLSNARIIGSGFARARVSN